MPTRLAAPVSRGGSLCRGASPTSGSTRTNFPEASLLTVSTAGAADGTAPLTLARRAGHLQAGHHGRATTTGLQRHSIAWRAFRLE